MCQSSEHVGARLSTWIIASWIICICNDQILITFIKNLWFYWHWLILNKANFEKWKSGIRLVKRGESTPWNSLDIFNLWPMLMSFYSTYVTYVWWNLFGKWKIHFIDRTNKAAICSVYWHLFSFGNCEVKSFTHGIPWHGQRKEERRVVKIVKTKTMKKPETIRGKLILKRENVQRQSI